MSVSVGFSATGRKTPHSYWLHVKQVHQCARAVHSLFFQGTRVRLQLRSRLQNPSTRCLAIPVLLWIPQTLAHSHQLIPPGLGGNDHELGQHGDGIETTVVRRDNVRAVLRLEPLEEAGFRRPETLAGLNRPVDDVVAQLVHVVETPRLGRASEIRGSHVSRDEAKDIPERHLVVDHLVPAGGVVDFVEFAMRPRVVGDLMA